MSDSAVVEKYRAVCERIRLITEGVDPQLVVPACPEWTVRDVVAHVTGVAEAWVTHDIDDYGGAAWAHAQVDRRSTETIPELISEWRLFIDRFAGLPDEPGMGDPAIWAIGDAAVHEADLRAVVAPGTTLPDDTLGLLLQGAVGMWRRPLRNAGAPTLRIELDDGTAMDTGDDPQVTLRIHRHELFRMLMARRSAAQIRSYDWSGDPEPFLRAGLMGPNIAPGVTGLDTWPGNDLVETPVA